MSFFIEMSRQLQVDRLHEANVVHRHDLHQSSSRQSIMIDISERKLVVRVLRRCARHERTGRDRNRRTETDETGVVGVVADDGVDRGA